MDNDTTPTRSRYRGPYRVGQRVRSIATSVEYEITYRWRDPGMPAYAYEAAMVEHGKVTGRVTTFNRDEIVPANDGPAVPADFPAATYEAYDYTAATVLATIDAVTSVEALVANWKRISGDESNYNVHAYYDDVVSDGLGTRYTGAPKFVEFRHPLTGGLEFQFARKDQ